MRKFIISAVVAAMTLVPSVASAQRYYSGGSREVRQEVRECRRELRRADSRREYQRERRECRREISQAQRNSRRGWQDHRWNRYDRHRYDRHDRYYRR
jgi:hypothetical protein